METITQKSLIDAQALALQHIVEKNSYRPAISCIRLEKTQAIATDGRILLTLENSQLMVENIQEPVSIPPSQIKEAQKQIKQKKGFNKTADDEQTHHQTNEISEHQYPNWQQVVPGPQAYPEENTIRLSIPLLEKMIKTLKKMKVNAINLTPHKGGNLKPLEIKGKTETGRKVKGVIMPMNP